MGGGGVGGDWPQAAGLKGLKTQQGGGMGVAVEGGVCMRCFMCSAGCGAVGCVCECGGVGTIIERMPGYGPLGQRGVEWGPTPCVLDPLIEQHVRAACHHLWQQGGGRDRVLAQHRGRDITHFPPQHLEGGKNCP